MKGDNSGEKELIVESQATVVKYPLSALANTPVVQSEYQLKVLLFDYL